MAFCTDHCGVVSELGYKTELRAFLKSCSDKQVSVNPKQYSKKMKDRVQTVLDDISRASKSCISDSSTDAQG